MRFRLALILSVAALSSCVYAPDLGMPKSAVPGHLVDITPWGEVTGWKGNDPATIEKVKLDRDDSGAWIPARVPGTEEYHVGVAFDTPRKFQAVRVVPAELKALREKPEFRIEYWRNHWPDQGSGGWARVDDDYHGRWDYVPGEIAVQDLAFHLDFPPLDEKNPLRYRVARKVRVVFKNRVPVKRIEVLSTASWQEQEVHLHYLPEEGAPVTKHSLEGVNGYLLTMGTSGFEGKDELNGKEVEWSLKRDKPKSVLLKFLGTTAPANSSEATQITLRGKDGFTFCPITAGSGPMWVEHAGVMIADKPEVPAVEKGRKTFYQAVPDEPEQTYERAAKEIPQLNRTNQGHLGLYLPLGAAQHRQEIYVRYNGDLGYDRSCIKSPGKEIERLKKLEHSSLLIRLPSGKKPNTREVHSGERGTRQEVLDGYLPVVTTRWKEDGIDFEQIAFATLTQGNPAKPDELKGDEAMVLCARIKATNYSDEPRETVQWMRFDGPEQPIALRNEWVEMEGGRSRRIVFVGDAAWKVEGGQLSLPISLKPKQSITIDVRVPWGAVENDGEAWRVKGVDFEAEKRKVADFWRSVVKRGVRWEIPEPIVQDYWRSNLCHVYINADKDVDSGHVVYPAGTFAYNVCANEAVHQLRSLDLRGHHATAERGLNAFLELQGTRPLHGRFKSSKGVLHGLKVKPGTDYQTFNYNLDHGFVLWMLAEHYRITGDKKWLSKYAQNFVDACDFVTRERKNTMDEDDRGGRAWHWGLMPEGHLEDPPEFLHWYAVNAYAYRGMRDAADVLADVGHPEAARLKKDAEDFGKDLRRAIQESRLRAPLERLRDGRWIPFFPTRCHLRGRDIGWIRDALYGPVHLIDCGVFDARSQEATWILEDAEDNVFVTGSHGRQLKSLNDWFSWGGITIQSNLLPTTLVYLEREEVKHSIRCFYNTLASHLYPDVRAFTEHPVERYGKGAGPFYKTPDESAWVTWLRCMMIREEGENLWIGQATPRGWLADGKRILVEGSPTYFGPVSFTIESSAASGKIRASIDPPKRRACGIVLRLRHPEGKKFKSVKVDGKAWTEVDPEAELIRLGKIGKKVEVEATY